MRWWLYEQVWIRSKRWWTGDSFIGVHMGASSGTMFVVVGRNTETELAVCQVGVFGATGTIEVSTSPPLTRNRLAGFEGVL